MASKVKLLGAWPSPFSRRVEIALKIKGIQYEYIEEDLSNKSPELLKYNPVHKKIPVLVHNGKPIAESLIILQYIDETWTNYPLLPEDPYDRAMARFWTKFVEEKVLLAAWKASLCEDKDREQAVEETSQQLKVLEIELKGKEFFGGEAIGFVDIVAIVDVYWVTVMQEIIEVDWITDDKFPILKKWMEKLLDLDVIRECIPPREKHASYMRTRMELAKAASK